jgi:aryl-alcohol dehydrogenase-like predicted oxidoreductase
VEQRELGRSGVAVSRVILGCGNFGGVGSAPAFFGQGIAHDEAFRIMDAAWELGLTTFDTADAYGGGRSETWIGEWLATKDSDVRDAITIQTKTFNPLVEGDDRGLARPRILRQIDTSLARLGVERVGLYLAHAFDPNVPQEETLRGFDELVRAGKVEAVGASNFSAEQLAEAVELSELEELARYELVQNSFSLLDRDDEETVFPVCREHGLGYEAFGPLAGGWLTGKYRRGQEYPEGSRMTQRPESYLRYATDAVFDGLDALEREALARGVSMPGLALAWLLAVPEVTAVVVGPTCAEHLEPVREALALELTPADREHLRGLLPV